MTTGGPDPFCLRRFVDAQSGAYERAKTELLRGAKRSHWMWFMFPQLRGLGRSPAAVEFGITGRAEAEAYLAHPLLGSRLRELTGIVTAIDGKSAHDIFGSPDDMKFHSSMTLFAVAAEDPSAFGAALERFYGGVHDPATVDMLGS